MTIPQKYTAREFYLEDVPRTLFPLATNRILIERGAEKLMAFAAKLAGNEGSFPPQHRVHANKDALHLRRTVKLDAVSEMFLYEIIFKNRNLFRRPKRPNYRHFGYRFEGGRPVPASKSYSEFRSAINELSIASEEYISFDISSYFNNIYHHDISAWFGSIGADESDVLALGKFLREANAGRSLDCLPHGLYPSKMIGNDFLRFIEESALVRSSHVLRFMDDVYLFDNNAETVRADFAMLQKLVGLKGLTINSSKTFESAYEGLTETEDQIDELKVKLLKKRRDIMVSHYDPADDSADFDDLDDELDVEDSEEAAASEEAEDPTPQPLTDEEVGYITELLSKQNLSEEDAELILVVTRDNSEILSKDISRLATSFPHLAKQIFGICKDMQDKAAIAEALINVITSDRHVGEFQLFWFGAMLESYLLDTPSAPALIRELSSHANATDITRAKILEIPDQRYGLPEMRSRYLADGRSDWLAWASAIGCRSLKPGPRNYALKYFAKASPYNALIASIISQD